MIYIISYYVSKHIGGLLLGALCITSFSPPSDLK